MASEHRTKDEQGRTVMAHYLDKYYNFTYTEDDYDTVDFTATATTNSNKTYVGDVKAYLNPDYPRYSYKFKDYQVDFEKLRQIKKRALNTNSKPILVGIFTDKLYVWDLNKSDWEHTATWKMVNKNGCNYGDKEYELQAYLYFSDSVFSIDREEGDYE